MRSRWIIAALGALGVASPAMAICDASNTFTYDFNSAAVATLSYGSATGYNYTASNPLGSTRPFNVKFVANGVTASVNINGTAYATPRIDTAVIASETNTRTLTLGGTFSARSASITSGTRTIATTFTFATPIRDLSMVVHDIDYTLDQYRDWLHISGSDGTATYTPALSGPFGNNNGGSTPTATGSSLLFGPYASANPALSANEAAGTGASNNTGSNAGNINISFAQPVTTVTIRYGNYPLQTGETQTGQQAMGISKLTFCPMPNLNVAKSSAPYASAGNNRFNVPGADVSYSLTVTNTGGSPVDVGSLVLTDPLPANVTFYNGDYDPASPGMGPVQVLAGSSGVTLPASGIAFSTDGTTYSASAAAGYTTAIRYVRLTPTGSLAANSSVTFRFRARIN